MYIIKEIKIGNPLIEGEESRWGIFLNVKDEFHEGRVDGYGSMICMCFSRILAVKIAKMLELDCYIEEKMMEI